MTVEKVRTQEALDRASMLMEITDQSEWKIGLKRGTLASSFVSWNGKGTMQVNESGTGFGPTTDGIQSVGQEIPRLQRFSGAQKPDVQGYRREDLATGDRRSYCRCGETKDAVSI